MDSSAEYGGPTLSICSMSVQFPGEVKGSELIHERLTLGDHTVFHHGP